MLHCFIHQGNVVFTVPDKGWRLVNESMHLEMLDGMSLSEVLNRSFNQLIT